MDADEVRVKDFLESKGLAPERFTKQEIRAGKTPDFRVLLNGDLQFFCEVKSSQESRWLDEQLENSEAGQLVGGSRNDLIFNRLASDVHQAISQFDAVNGEWEVPNVLALVNHDEMCGFNDVLAVVTGNFYAENGAAHPIYRQFSHGRIREEKRRIDLFIWLDDYKPHRLLFSQTNEGHHAKLLAGFGLLQDDITQIDS
ncbi:hypothetical protein [Nitrosococcus oceani]|uniref:hypothetical protein n=1 Tax=Nitrosococcus oceani TaxID=1229 RepID=UPI0004E91DBE|nr:hypothetical protein [Nitrosococcus oceani]KFI22276.1 hypothetical protein HW44_10385 [Nitrosococcus oceani]